jgi:hypothetical protein
MIEYEALLWDLAREAQPVVVGPSRGPVPIDPRCTVIIGTSGSTNYLSDTTGGQRFWLVGVPCDEPAQEDGQACDGLHDEGAPAHYLCSRCFPDRGDRTELEGEEYQHDAEKEID